MGLADYQPPAETIEYKGGSFDVRGIALDDLALLLKNHMADIDALIDIYEKEVREDVRVTAIAQYAMGLVKEAPGLVANAIALCSDAPDSVDKARRLPLAVQVKALEAIGRLTFEEAGGPKKFFESLKTLFGAVRPTPKMTGSLT